MSLLRRRHTADTEARDLNGLATLIERYGRMAGTYQAGQSVTTDSARRVAAVWRCQHMLADIVAGLPIDQFRKRPDGSREEVTPGEFVARPSNFVDGFEWRYQMMLSALDRGNSYAYVTEFDTAYRYAVKAEVLDPYDVAVTRRDGALAPPTYKVGGKDVDAKRILHLRAFGPAPGSVLGMAPIDYAAATIGTSLASRKYGADWYAKGGHPTVALTYAGDLAPGDGVTAKEIFHQSTAEDHVVVFGKDWKLQPLQVNPDQALFLDSINATAVDICGFYGIPPEMLGYASSGGGSLTYANREQRAIDLLVFTVQWWIGRMERLIGAQTPAPQFVKINVDALLRSDTLTRYLVHDIGIRSGMWNVDERRSLEDAGPVPSNAGQQFLWPPYASRAESTGGAQ